MESYKILGYVVAWVVGLYLRGRIYEEKNGYKLNDRLRKKKYMLRHLFLSSYDKP